MDPEIDSWSVVKYIPNEKKAATLLTAMSRSQSQFTCLIQLQNKAPVQFN